MIELECDDRSIQTGVERMQHGTGHRDAIVGLQHRRNIREHDADRVVLADAQTREGRSKLPGPLIKGPVVHAVRTMNHGCSVRKDMGRPGEKTQRAQWRIVRLVLFQSYRVRIVLRAHLVLPDFSSVAIKASFSDRCNVAKGLARPKGIRHHKSDAVPSQISLMPTTTIAA